MNKIAIISFCFIFCLIVEASEQKVQTQDKTTTLSLTNKDGETIVVASEFDLKFTIANAPEDCKITYTIDNENILINNFSTGTIQVKNGENSIIIKGVKQGESTITFSYNNKPLQTLKYVVNEAPRKVSEIKIIPVLITKTGEGPTLTATKSDNNNSVDVSWCSSDERIAAIDDNGKITAKKEGEIDITATSKNGSQTDKLKLKVEKEKSNYLYWIILLTIMLVSGIVFFYKTLEQTKTKLGEIRKDVEDLKKEVSDNVQTRKDVFENAKTELDQKYKEKVEGLEKKINVFEKKLYDKLDKNNDADKGNSKKDTIPNNFRYADAINNGEFYNVTEQPGDLSVFELKLTNNTTATFKVYSEAEKRVIARPGNLEGCETDIVQGGKSLETITIGKAHEAGGKWIVDSALKLKIV